MNNALIVGGSNGIGLAIALELAKSCRRVNIVDRVAPDTEIADNIDYRYVDLQSDNFGFLNDYDDIDTLVITAGFGRVAPFESIVEKEISSSFQVNAISVFKILNHYFRRMQEPREFRCAVMGSISGLVVSPLFALYGATKAAVCNGIESLNIELAAAGTANRILNVSPGSIAGTKFNGGANDLSKTADLAQAVIKNMNARETLLIPDYEAVFKGVIDRYRRDPHTFGMESYQYKIDGGRMNLKPQVRVGYLSGTFDLFHIGHLNLLRQAKQYCDYLVVGIHKDASHKGKEVFIPFEERCEIVGNINYVDRVIESEPEDCDVYIKGRVKYDYLFVGSDYKGTERFNRYEAYFADKGVAIVYFPYTQGTSSSQLRDTIVGKEG